ncbi:MAG: VOC family protein [Polyangiales bacterium]
MTDPPRPTRIVRVGREGEPIMAMKKYEPGTFNWIDLGTTDSAAAKKFYSALFGWEFADMPAGPGMIYSMCRLRGKEVAALYELGPDMRKQGIPPHWKAYVAVASADEAQKKAEAAGGKILAPAFDVLDVGRQTVIQDPTGATISAWQAKKHVGAAMVQEPGAFCWAEVLTRDTAKAKDFYTKVFGWTAKDQDMGPMGTYTVFQIGESMKAGMMKMPEQAGNAPPFWSVYIQVGNCDATVKKATELGGKVLMAATDIPSVGRFATLQDPQGAVVSILAQ